MNDLESGSLILDRRIKGHLPVTRFAVSGVGSVTVAVPDANQPRLYHLGRQLHTGEWEESTTFSVQKVTSWDLAASGDTFVTATNDDLYLFHADQKKRLLTDRRETYVGVSMTAMGDAIAVASADMLMSSYSVTLVSGEGVPIWTKDLPATLTSVQTSPDGALIAVGSDEGLVYLLDPDHRVVWEFDAGEPISTICLPSSDGTVIAGMKSGLVAAIRDAGKIWDVEGHGPVTACVGTSDGKVIVVARDGGEDAHTVECIADDGRVFLGHPAPAAVVSVACSEDGRYLALSCRDGSLQVIETQGQPSHAADAQQAASLFENAVGMMNRGEYGDAVSSLSLVLQLAPTHVDAAVRLAEAAHAFLRESLQKAEECLVDERFGETVGRLNAALGNCILAQDMAAEVISARRKAAQTMLARARELADIGAIDEARDVVDALIGLDITNTDARELLGRLEHEIIDRVLREADEALAHGKAGDAVGLLQQAYDRDPSDVIADKLRHARAEEALAEGLALYKEQKFSQALFQFRKVLSLDPENAEALKHIEYAEKLSEDDGLHDRFSRLE